jgi:hypothetical protein
MMMEETITIVSGLPRSGTSMMMNILTAGGIQALTDGERSPDESNPRGYFELEKVKHMGRDRSFLRDAVGKAVKVVSPLLKHLPPEYSYRVIFMERNTHEVLASQRQMMIKRGELVPDDDEEMAAIYARHLQDVKSWLSLQPNMKVIYVSYNEVLETPRVYVDNINRFLGNGLDAAAMLEAVDRSLYRQRSEDASL